MPSQTWAQANLRSVNWRLLAHLVQCTNWDHFWMEREYWESVIGFKILHQITNRDINCCHLQSTMLPNCSLWMFISLWFILVKNMSRPVWEKSTGSALWRVLSNCLTCQKQNAAKGQQLMLDLPGNKLIPDKPLFSNVGIDSFGPLYVKQGRSTVKSYGVFSLA